MQLVDLQDFYKLDDNEHDKLYSILKKEVVVNSVSERKCNIIIGQKASGKSTFSKRVEKDGFVLYDKKQIDMIHPSYKEVLNEYPFEFPSIIAPDVVKWRNQLLNDLVREGINFNYETTGNNNLNLNNLIELLKENNYQINIYFISINYLESRLRVYENYIRCLERGKMDGFFQLSIQMRAFGNIPDIADSLNFDDFESVSFLDSNLFLFNYCVPKQVFVDTLRGLYNDVSYINFNKRIEYIVNYLARYGYQVKDVPLEKIFEELDFLKQYYNLMSTQDEQMRKVLK